MQNEIYQIKDSIINRLIVFFQIFGIITYTFSLLRILDLGTSVFSLTQTITFGLLSLLFIFRKKLSYYIKLNIISVIFSLFGIFGFYRHGMIGSYYWFFIPVFLNSIFQERKLALIYTLIISIFITLISFGYYEGILISKNDLNNYYNSKFVWITFISSLFSFLLFLLYVSRKFYEMVEKNFNEKLITDSKLKKSEYYLKYAQKVAKIGHWNLDIKNNRLYWSEEVYRIFEIDPEKFEPNYETFINTIHPDDREMVNTAYTESINNNSQYEITYRIIVKNGAVKYVKVKCNTSYDSEGNPVESMGIVQDVTELIRTESALKENEYRLREAQQLAHFGHFVLDFESDTINWSDEMFQIFELNNSARNLSIRTIEEYLHPEDVEKYNKALKIALNSQKDTDFEIRIILQSGTIKFLKGKLLAEFNKKGIATKLFGVVFDNTNMKQIELELIQHRDFLESKIEEKTEELKKKNEELNKTNNELFSINEELNNKNIEINEQKSELEVTIIKLKETQEQLIQVEKMASLGILTAGVAHEINNPLNFINCGVLGLEDYFKLHFPDHVEKVKPLFNGINTGVERAATIVRGLNQFSRNSKSPEEDCDIHLILENCIAMVTNQIKYKAEIERDFIQECIIIKGNVGKLHQVFINILTNAAQAIVKDGIIKIKTFSKNNKFIVEIEDNGCGIEKENLPKIADPFFTTKDPGEGTGLGLSITYTILQELGASINFQSEVNKGTIVTVTLPLTQNPQ